MKLQKRSALVISVLLVVSLGVLVVVAAINAREAARQSACQGKMNQLQLALRMYESTNGHFPPAIIPGPDGKPWHSWRVLLLPYLGERAIYDQYRFDEPWNGPNNQKLANKNYVESRFQCPSGPAWKRNLNTNYVAVIGRGTAFPSDSTTRSDSIKDGLENTILLVEIANSDIHWMEPRDLEYDLITLDFDANKESLTSVSSCHPAGPAVVFADEIKAYRLRKPFSSSTLQALLTIAGGEKPARAVLENVDDNGLHLIEPSE